MHDIHERLAFHLSTLGMGLPHREDLFVLKNSLNEAEAEVLLLLPTRVAPLQPVGVNEIARNSNLSSEKLVDMLECLSEQGLLFCGKTREGGKGYALQQVGFGFPQTFFWKEDN